MGHYKVRVLIALSADNSHNRTQRMNEKGYAERCVDVRHYVSDDDALRNRHLFLGMRLVRTGLEIAIQTNITAYKVICVRGV